VKPDGRRASKRVITRPFLPPRRWAFALQWTEPEDWMAKKTASKRELINTGTDKRYVRRGAAGQFKESDDVGRSLAQDRQRKAKTKTSKGQGDRGDR
jgi:hypothetical protein